MSNNFRPPHFEKRSRTIGVLAVRSPTNPWQCFIQTRPKSFPQTPTTAVIVDIIIADIIEDIITEIIPDFASP